MIKKILISLFILCLASFNAFAGMSDVFDYSYWSNKTGYTEGSINDIQYKYFKSLGYSGTLNDMFFAWLVDETGLPSTASFNDLILTYFSSVTDNYVRNTDNEIILNDNGDQVEVG